MLDIKKMSSLQVESKAFFAVVIATNSLFIGITIEWEAQQRTVHDVSSNRYQICIEVVTFLTKLLLLVHSAPTIEKPDTNTVHTYELHRERERERDIYIYILYNARLKAQDLKSDQTFGPSPAMWEAACDTDVAMSTAEVQLVAASGLLQTLQLSIHVPVADLMRRSLKSIGKQAKGIFIFALGATIVEEEMCLEKLGVTAGSKIEVTVLDSLRHCFEWAVYDLSSFNNLVDKSTFRRGDRAEHTGGVRTDAALPRDTLCYLRFSAVGTHACLGVGTRNCKLAERKYVHLFGQDENSWALCFGNRDLEVSACHRGQSCTMQDLSGKPIKRPRLDELPSSFFVCSFLISASGQMVVTLPGRSEEIVVPFEIPPDLEVFIVASTVFGHSTISISSSSLF